MTSSPFVTIVIPAYNAVDFLSDTIQSVLNQSYENWELLVVNDGSTDGTSALVNTYCELDHRIHLITKGNGGVSTARNLGIKKSKGELIAFLDSDDLWLKDKLSVHVDYMRSHPQIGLSFARVELIESNGETTNKLTNNIEENLEPQTFFYTNPTITTSNIVVRKSVFDNLQGFDESIQYSEDIDLLFRIAFQKKWIIQGIDQVLIQYRVHSSGLSSKLTKMEEGWVALMENAHRIAPQLVTKHYSAAHAAHLQYWAKQTLRLDMSPFTGVTFINRALISDWKSLHKKPKMIAIALLVYLRLVTFNMLKFNV